MLPPALITWKYQKHITCRHWNKWWSVTIQQFANLVNAGKVNLTPPQPRALADIPGKDAYTWTGENQFPCRFHLLVVKDLPLGPSQLKVGMEFGKGIQPS